jgi:hypothetical protein
MEVKGVNGIVEKNRSKRGVEKREHECVLNISPLAIRLPLHSSSSLDV